MLKIRARYVVAAAVFAVVVPAQLASAAVQAGSVPYRIPPLAKGTYADVTGPHGVATMPEEITNSGLIVGCYQSPGGHLRGFTEQGSTFTTLTHRSGGRASTTTCASGANKAGVVVGYYAGRTGPNHGFVYRQGAFRTIDDPRAGRKTGQGTTAVDISDTGVIVGSFVTGKNVQHGFILRNGRFRTVDAPGAIHGTILDGIADNGTVTGDFTSATGSHAFWLRRGVFHLVNVPGARNTSLACISKRTGLLVGTYQVAGRRKTFGFTDAHGVFRTLRDPSATSATIPQCGNDSGLVVGFYFGSSGEAGFAFTPSTAQEPAAAPRRAPAATTPRRFPSVRTGLRQLN